MTPSLWRHKNFILFWFGQFLTSLGSSMTGFAVTIWAFQETGSALILSISGMLVMLPRAVGGILTAPFVDKLNKKRVILFSDLAAGLCTLVLFVLFTMGRLEIWHVFVVNFSAGIFRSVQIPANAVVVSLLVPKAHYVKAGGLQSFSQGTVQVLSPMLAAALLGLVDMNGVMAFDMLTMLFAAGTLLFFVKIPVMELTEKAITGLRHYLNDLREGVTAVLRVPILRPLMVLHIYINFVSGITYFNLISPMILLRTNGDAQALALVNGGLGIGGIVGGFLIALLPATRSKIKMMYVCIGLSFLLGDFSFALGQTLWLWVVAGFLSNLVIPPFTANEDYFWRTTIPLEIQGRAFSFRNVLNAGVIPLGMVLGGVLADYVFEPFATNRGGNPGDGMGLMFLITGITGVIICLCGFFNKRLAQMENDVG